MGMGMGVQMGRCAHSMKRLLTRSEFSSPALTSAHPSQHLGPDSEHGNEVRSKVTHQSRGVWWASLGVGIKGREVA
eukprot:3261473-Rhodomonas_salina.2